MPLLEDHTASFIVRIWREMGGGDSASQEWRGSIEHVQSGRRTFFRDLRAITEFMQSHLAEIGIDTPLRFWELMTPDLDADGAETVPAPPVSPKRGRRQRHR
jgi:hypothetical protein